MLLIVIYTTYVSLVWLSVVATTIMCEGSKLANRLNALKAKTIRPEILGAIVGFGVYYELARFVRF